MHALKLEPNTNHVQDAIDVLNRTIKAVIAEDYFGVEVLSYLQAALKELVKARAACREDVDAFNGQESTSVGKFQEWKPPALTPTPLPISDEIALRWYRAGMPEPK